MSAHPAEPFCGKCFTQCRGRRIKLDGKIIDEKYKEAHEDAINMRHNFAAHSGADKFEEVKVALVLPPNKKSNMAPILYKELIQPDVMFTHPENDIGFREVVIHLQEKVLDKMRNLTDKIMFEEIAPKGKDYWYKKAKKS